MLSLQHMRPDRPLRPQSSAVREAPRAHRGRYTDAARTQARGTPEAKAPSIADDLDAADDLSATIPDTPPGTFCSANTWRVPTQPCAMRQVFHLRLGACTFSPVREDRTPSLAREKERTDER